MFERNPETDTLKDANGNDFKLDSPFGDELPENGFVPDLKGYLAPLEDGSGVEVKVSPTSDRLQLLERFDAWDVCLEEVDDQLPLP